MFYRYNLHQQSQDPSLFPWPTPEQFEATVARPGDETEFEMQAGPAGTSGGGDEAEDDQDMADLIDFLL